MDALLAGLALGLSAGLSPGPLLALIIRATLTRGWRGGIQAAIAPLISDLPIVLLSITILSVVPQALVIALSAAGALVLAWFGIHGLREARTAQVPDPRGTLAAQHERTWARAALVNLLSPSPWLFWGTVGAPILVAAWRASPASGIAFVLGFYLLLIGSKVALAVGLSATRHRLSPLAYRGILMASAVLMLVLAVVLAVNVVQLVRG